MDNLNKEVLIEQLEKYYIKNDIFSLVYQINSNKYCKFKNLNYDTIDINKYINSLVISNDFILSKTHTILTILKIIRNKKILNFGFMYGNINKNKINNKFITLSLSFISKDGEYKHRLLDINVINYIFNSPIFNKTYKYLSKNYANKEYTLDFEIYNLENNKIKQDYKRVLSNNILILKYYNIIWIIELYIQYKNKLEINIQDELTSVLFSPTDIVFFQTLYQNNQIEIDELIPKIIYYNSNNKLELGQKLLPFSYIQLKEYNHLIHFQWKELLINRIINNLIHNNNSICFSLFIDLIFITKSNKYLYNNEEIYNKINYSDKIQKILLLLYSAKRTFNELYSNNLKNKIINKLENKIQNLINETQLNMIMSNVSLSFLSEYSGKTLFHYLNLQINNQNNNKIGNLMTDYNIMCKYLFDIIYSLYCLNLKGIIHGDLHLNNITISLITKIINNSYVLYDLNNEFNDNILEYLQSYPYIYDNNDINSSYSSSSNNSSSNRTNKFSNKIRLLNKTYNFKHYGYFPCIIDYSRSFLLLNLIDESIIEQEKNQSRNKYIKNETKRIINELNKIFPNYIKNNTHKLKFLFKNKNFNILFLYFSAYDTFTFITNLLIFMKKASINHNITVNPKILNLLTSLSKKAYYYLEQLLNEENYTSNKMHQFPNYLLIKEFFTDYKSTENDLDKNITHYFNLENITTYNTITKIKEKNKQIITNYLSSNKINEGDKKIIKDKFKNLLNIDNLLQNNEIEIEKLINKEYYNIKSNMHIMSTNINKDINMTYDVTTNSILLNDY